MRDRVCLICFDTFKPGTKWVRVCSDLCRLRLWGQNTDITEKDDCFYCGDKAVMVHRFEPPRGAEDLRIVVKDLKIPLCLDCADHMPRDMGVFSWAERWGLVVKRLETTEGFAVTDWDKEELADMGRAFRDDFERLMERKAWLKDRWNYAKRRMEAAHFWDCLIRGKEWRTP